MSGAARGTYAVVRRRGRRRRSGCRTFTLPSDVRPASLGFWSTTMRRGNLRERMLGAGGRLPGGLRRAAPDPKVPRRPEGQQHLAVHCRQTVGGQFIDVACRAGELAPEAAGSTAALA